jgi:hypothetical protein
LYVKRILAGAAALGVMGLPAAVLGTGIAAADTAPAPGAECTDAAQCPQQPADQKKEEKKNNASGPTKLSDIKIPPELSKQIAKSVGSGGLPSPVSASVPVSIGLPDLVLPDVVPDVSVPFILNPPSVNVPAPKMGPINNPLNLGPPWNPLKLP